MSDPNWSDRFLVLPFDGLDAATTSPDVSSYGQTVTFEGGAELDTAEKKWGDSSVYLDGTGARVRIADAANLEPLDNDMCVECWFYPESGASTGTVIAKAFTLFGGHKPSVNVRWNSGNTVNITISLNGTSDSLNGFAGGATAGQWHHVAVLRDGADYWAYLNGNYVGTLGSAASGLNDHPDDWIIGADETGQRPFQGWVDDVRITIGSTPYSGGFGGITVPTAAHPLVVLADPEIIISSPSPLYAPEAVVTNDPPIANFIAVPSPLAAPLLAVENDFTALVGVESQKYVMRITGDPVVEYPISSWQATLQTDRQNYAQCVIPAAQDFATTLAARQGTEEFIIYRTVSFLGTTVETELARVPLTTININSGAFRYTVTASGYSDPVADPPPSQVRNLTGFRQLSQSLGGNIRVRTDIDWLLRPGQSVAVADIELTANYINYFVTSSGDSYMDVGNRG